MFNLRASSLVLALGLLSAASISPALAQNGAGTRQPASNPFVGNWVYNFKSNGGTFHVYEQFGTDGTWRSTSIFQGGDTPGFRTQQWGKYTVQRTGENAYSITTLLSGFAPTQVCTPGGPCQKFDFPRNSVRVLTFVDNDHLRDNYQPEERVAQIPQQLMVPVEATIYTAPPPPAPPAATGGGVPSGSARTYHVPGQGGTCDNLQEQRKCTINDGYMYTGQDGCQHCSK